MVFADRRDAGGPPAAALLDLHRPRALLLGGPAGGGRGVAAAPQAPLAVIVPRKLRAPYNPEFAIGAVAEGGAAFVDEELARTVGAGYLAQEIAAQRAEIARRVEVYRNGKPLPVLAGTC